MPRVPGLSSGAHTTRLNRRRLRLANAVFQALERAGANPTVRDPRAFAFRANVDGSDVFFALDPQQAYVGGLSSDAARNMLAFKLKGIEPSGESRKIWNERRKPLEQQLTDVVVGILMAGEDNRRDALQREHRHRQLERIRVESEENRRRAREEQAAIKKLEADAAAFRLAADIRALVDAARGATESGAEIDAWARWARSHADRIDPIANGTVIDRGEPDPFDRRSW